MIVEITIYPAFETKDVNMYIATYIHQQLVGNSNYIDSAIIVNCDAKPNDTYTTIINIDPDQLNEYTPNIAIDWQAIDHIEVEVIKPDIVDRIAKIVNSIKSNCEEYPAIENYDLSINYVGNNKININGNSVSHIVFNLADWFKEED